MNTTPTIQATILDIIHSHRGPIAARQLARTYNRTHPIPRSTAAIIEMADRLAANKQVRRHPAELYLAAEAYETNQ